MARLSRLEENFERDYRDAFEDMATHMLVAEFGLPHAPLRRKNQAGIEADPVTRDDGRSFAYQVKYLDATTEARAQEEPFKGAVREARAKGATDLVLYLNKRLTQDPKTRQPPQWERNVADEAGEAGVRLHWRELSRTETMLDQPRFAYIRDMYLGGPDGEDAVVGFYRDTCDRFFGDKGGELYGDVPLSECYIEPTVDVGGEGGPHPTAREWVESFVEGDDTVAVLCGEPGHGKTSLCRKAVADFYKAGWLAGRVPNVFCFSLNPANTDALGGGQLNLYRLLSWGGDRTDTVHKVGAEHCRGALVFLDAFDELLEWHPAFGIRTFIRDYVARFQEGTKSHVVITTRSMAVDSDASHLQIGRRLSVPVVRLRLISKARQISWIGEYAARLRDRIAGSTEPSSRGQRDKLGRKLEEMEIYAEEYHKMDKSTGLQAVLGIPIIFRMVVAARYLPKPGESITRIYDDLFDATWARHEHKAAGPSSDPLEETRRRLMRHALRVFAGDADTAVVSDAPNSPWTFAFYTTRNSDGGERGRSRVGFLHRSFYQHFLAREVVSWFERYANSADEATLLDNLSYLARRRLDETTLGYINEMHGDAGGKKGLGNAFAKAYEILKETDGILSLPSDERDAAQIKAVVPLERANNIFWNVVSVCSLCGHEVNVDKINAYALRSHNLDKCVLRFSHLEGADLERADLRRAHLKQADLRGASLRGAHLEEAYLKRADLRGANLRKAYLGGAHLEETYLERAVLRAADLRAAHLEKARLEQASLRGAHLRSAYLGQARLKRANLRGADLRWVHLEGTDLRGANLRGANLRWAYLQGAHLEGADLSGAHFTRESDLELAFHEGANLEGVHFDEGAEGPLGNEKDAPDEVI